ncbi:MAG: hypothetical protein UX26_C0009G0019 [Parcubacteria group bacterium GW2011_GWC1_45_9]|nr:MAG: hypothetical protein UW85_C0010G0023 [Parcubacteria group bacterium GW2011_GWA1_Parcubacteria_45_10]KKT88614.1 MAG: hypothetical protein UW89_C0006G0022 [Parcubacteria group bacterium GW2011_GWB1_45_10]KKU17054.1 MAG: hypothetical protein UX26_C0009G0019 [Parcubacteria group bacterium GW2011_GWC1_45_9]HCI05269.1 hypothetical protein [Patescibacteria group bacterium]
MKLSRLFVKRVPEYIVSRRPWFGFKQIRSRFGLWPGRKVIMTDLGGKFSFTLTSWPFKDGKDWCVKGIKKFRDGDLMEVSRFLSDSSIYPYDDGKWNGTNYIERRFLLWPF